jgi:hypothetical protein
MNRWIAIAVPIIGVLVIGVLVLGVVYFQETNEPNGVQAEITNLEAKISALEADLADAEAKVLALEVELLVTFPDANLEATIREAIDKHEGPIYTFNLEALVILEASTRDFWRGMGVYDIGGNNISDITGLEYCVNLLGLYLGGNNISDISVLAGLTNLEVLGLSDTNSSDISALAGLTNLQELYLNDTNISDIAALAGLTNLQELYLNDTNISDISPLVTNSGLSAGDIVNLSGNPLSTTSVDVYIPQLEARGVNIIY